MSASSNPRRSHARLMTAGALVAGIGLSAAVVWQASYSAFASTTSNPTNNWSAGTVSLSDDDSDTAMFNATNLKPGSTGTKCIAVTSTGSLPSAVKLYGTNATTTKALSSSINLTVTYGTGTTGTTGFGSCSGFTPATSNSSVYSGTLANFATTATNYATGLGTWAPTGTASETKIYQFSYTVDPNTPNTSQGGSAAIGFTWEAQNS